VIAAGAVSLAVIWEAAWTASGASNKTGWLTTIYDGAGELMPIYEDKSFLPSLHLPYLGQTDLPGSDAPVNPPQPPPQKKSSKRTASTGARNTPPREAAKRAVNVSARKGIKRRLRKI
jgi:hypothetical protein